MHYKAFFEKMNFRVFFLHVRHPKSDVFVKSVKSVIMQEKFFVFSRFRLQNDGNDKIVAKNKNLMSFCKPGGKIRSKYLKIKK